MNRPHRDDIGMILFCVFCMAVGVGALYLAYELSLISEDAQEVASVCLERTEHVVDVGGRLLTECER